MPASPPPVADTPLEIRHDAGTQRFSALVDNVQAVLDYHRDGGSMVIDHTGVPARIGGRGIAGQLVRAAFDHARREGWKVRTRCSYAEAWVRRHPDYAPLLG